MTSNVAIKSPYDLDDGDFPEESLGSLSADASQMNGCDQVGVIITQSRKPGLGSLATSSTFGFGFDRSPGYTWVTGSGTGAPPARADSMPSIDQRQQLGEQRLQNLGRSRPDRHHRNPCVHPLRLRCQRRELRLWPNQQLLAGNKSNGIIAFGTSTGDPGIISTYATLQARATGVVSDGSSNIFGTTAEDSAGLPGIKPPIDGRDRVGRLIADQHYLAGVTTMVRSAYQEWTKGHSAPAGWSRVGCLPNNAAAKTAYLTGLAGLTSSDSVYIDCPGNSGITLATQIGAGRVYFHGFIKGGNLDLPHATEVYIDNTNDSGAKVSATALTLGNNDTFCMRGQSCVDYDTDTCSSAVTNTSVHGRLMVRRGFLSSSTGGLLRLCNTTVVMEGGQLGAGTPASPEAACLLRSGLCQRPHRARALPTLLATGTFSSPVPPTGPLLISTAT